MSKDTESLVCRLREMSRRGYWPLLGDEAADEIERLQQERGDLRSALLNICYVYCAGDELPPAAKTAQAQQAADRALGRARAIREAEIQARVA